MKEISELKLPNDLRYSSDHEWVRPEGDMMRVGITDYAQDQLGDIVFVELPRVGESFKQGEEFGTVESVKAVAECYLPVSGEVVSVNTALEESPDLVNGSPYDKGWMVQLRPSDPGELDHLMNTEAYLDLLKGTQ
jgi:glycine cleavage system H protein